MPTTHKQRRRALSALFLGVDGGGTKTHSVICDARGKVLSEARSGPSNPLRIGVGQATANVVESVTKACDIIQRTTEELSCGVIGLAGARRADIKERMTSGLIQATGIPALKVLTDAEIALYACMGDGPGVVVISGTGSVCYGRDGLGRTSIAGGWGPFAGDEGGGIFIARKALQAVARASDGRGPKTDLSRLAASYFRASGPEDLIVAIYAPQMDNRKLAGFARIVISAARSGDKVAAGIIADAGEELGTAACAVIRDLKMEDRPVSVGIVGGVFGAGRLLTAPLLTVVRKCAEDAVIVKPRYSPAEAAGRMAGEMYHQSPRR